MSSILEYRVVFRFFLFFSFLVRFSVLSHFARISSTPCTRADNVRRSWRKTPTKPSPSCTTAIVVLDAIIIFTYCVLLLLTASERYYVVPFR